MPVLTAKMAVKVGEACTRSAMPMAIGAVTDLATRNERQRELGHQVAERLEDEELNKALNHGFSVDKGFGLGEFKQL